MLQVTQWKAKGGSRTLDTIWIFNKSLNFTFLLILLFVHFENDQTLNRS